MKGHKMKWLPIVAILVCGLFGVASADGVDTLRSAAMPNNRTIAVKATTSTFYSVPEAIGGRYGIPSVIQIMASDTSATDSIAFDGWLEFSIDGTNYDDYLGVQFLGITDTLAHLVEVSPSWGWNFARMAVNGNVGNGADDGVTVRCIISSTKKTYIP